MLSGVIYKHLDELFTVARIFLFCLRTGRQQLCGGRPLSSWRLSLCYLVFVSLPHFTFSLPSLPPTAFFHLPLCIPANSALQGPRSPAVLAVLDSLWVQTSHALILFCFLSFSTPLLLRLHPPPPPASCQTDPPCSLHPYWTMEKQSSRNSPDNCPPVIFFPPLSFVLCFSSPSFKAFFFPFFF